MSAACLLLHGFTGARSDVALLVGPLSALGLTVDVPLLPGHGTTLAEFRQTFFSDWLAAAEQRFEALAAAHEQVFVCGFSMGGALALDLAARLPVAGLAVLATPMWLYRIFPWQMRDIRLPFLPLLRHVLPVVPLPRRGAQAQEISPSERYEGGMPLAQLHSLGRGLARVRRALPAVTAPILIVQDARDRTVGPDAGPYIARRVSSVDVTLRFTHAEENVTGKHMITTHRETHGQVADLCSYFFRRLAVTSGL